MVCGGDRRGRWSLHVPPHDGISGVGEAVQKVVVFLALHPVVTRFFFRHATSVGRPFSSASAASSRSLSSSRDRAAIAGSFSTSLRRIEIGRSCEPSSTKAYLRSSRVSSRCPSICAATCGTTWVARTRWRRRARCPTRSCRSERWRRAWSEWSLWTSLAPSRTTRCSTERKGERLRTRRCFARFCTQRVTCAPTSSTARAWITSPHCCCWCSTTRRRRSGLCRPSWSTCSRRTTSTSSSQAHAWIRRCWRCWSPSRSPTCSDDWKTGALSWWCSHCPGSFASSLTRSLSSRWCGCGTWSCSREIRHWFGSLWDC